jgi:histidine triad (HIT) family protein
MEDAGCVFCRIARGEIPCEKVMETENFVAFKDRYPKTRGHALVIPKLHFATILDLPKELFQEFLDLTKEAAWKLMKENNAGGFNLVMNTFEVADQVVPHAHMHIMPRYENDGFKVASRL